MYCIYSDMIHDAFFGDTEHITMLVIFYQLNCWTSYFSGIYRSPELLLDISKPKSKVAPGLRTIGQVENHHFQVRKTIKLGMASFEDTLVLPRRFLMFLFVCPKPPKPSVFAKDSDQFRPDVNRQVVCGPFVLQPFRRNGSVLHHSGRAKAPWGRRSALEPCSDDQATTCLKRWPKMRASATTKVRSRCFRRLNQSAAPLKRNKFQSRWNFIMLVPIASLK